MIDAHGRKQLEELQKQVACEKKFACVDSALADLCKGIYHTELDIFECSNDTETPCSFCRPFGGTFVCTCPLRRLIARNFDRWSAESTGVLLKPTDKSPAES